jgi:hypothetical protein
LRKQFIGVEHECDGAVVDQFDRHVLAENARFYRDAGVAGSGNDEVVEFAGAVWGSGAFEAGTPTFAAVAVEGELGDEKETPLRFSGSCLEDAEVHLARRVRKDSQVEELFDHGRSNPFRIRGANTDKDEETPSDLADYGFVNFNASFIYYLY